MSTAAGQALRDQGQALATHAADSRTVARLDSLIRAFAASGLRFSANDVRDSVAVSSRGLVGARVDAARKRGELVAVGHEPSTLTSTRGHRITVWVGAVA